MLTKYVQWASVLPDGRPANYLIDPNVKVAAAVLSGSAEIHPEIVEFIENLQPEDTKSYVLAIAMGCGEFWGSNLNADYFGWDELYPADPKAKYGFKTFMGNKMFRRHKHTDTSPYFGRVVMVAYNEQMGRVEVIYTLDHDKPENDKTLRNMDKGIFPQVSMGCKIAYDVCTVCGHRSDNGKRRCDHIRLRRNHIYPDGTKAMMDNIRPIFFDLSIVDVPADCTAWSVKKVASMAYIPDMKMSSISKRVPSQTIVTNDVKEWLPGALLVNSAMDNSVDIPVESLMERVSPESLLHGMMLMGMKPKPNEFCRMISKMFGIDTPETFSPHIVDSVPTDEFAAFKDMISKVVKSVPELDGIKDFVKDRTSASPRVLRIVVVKKSPKEVMVKNAMEHTPIQDTLNNLYFMLGGQMSDIAVKSASVIGLPILRRVLDYFDIAKMRRVLAFLVGARVINQGTNIATTPYTGVYDNSAELATYTDIMTGMPAAVSLQMFNNMTGKTAGIASKVLIPPAVAYATKAYLDYKVNRDGVSTPTQELVRNNPKMMTLLLAISPWLAKKTGLNEASLLLGAGVAGYGAGQVAAKMASYDEIILTDDNRDDIFTKLAMENITPQRAELLKNIAAVFLAGAGIGAVVGVSPASDEIKVEPQPRPQQQNQQELREQYAKRYYSMLKRRGEL